VGSNANRGTRPVGAGGGHPCMAAHVRDGRLQCRLKPLIGRREIKEV
jgi:hypothetical protein